MRPSWALLSCVLLVVAALPPECLPRHGGGRRAHGRGWEAAGASCGGTSGREGTACMLACGLCSTAEFVAVMTDEQSLALSCGGGGGSGLDVGGVAGVATEVVAAAGRLQGEFFLDDEGGVEQNGTACIHYLVLDEPRDVTFHSRRRFHHLLTSYAPVSPSDPPPLSNATNATQAMRTLVRLVPFGVLDAAQEVDFPGKPPVRIQGNSVRWRSETAPAMLSPEQVIEYDGASCTGTAIVLVAAARAVGVPARIAGCSQSVVQGDDHHWIEFFDATDGGPFGDFWHTKEGVSRGNEGGPWDSPSGPMRGCLRGVVPRSTMNTIWAGSWQSSSFLPLQWANSTGDEEWAFVGGINRCGRYCTAWQCGLNSSASYTQAQCGPLVAGE